MLSPAKDAIWRQHSATFRRFWSGQVLAKGAGTIPDDACDVVIRIPGTLRAGGTGAQQQGRASRLRETGFDENSIAGGLRTTSRRKG